MRCLLAGPGHRRQTAPRSPGSGSRPTSSSRPCVATSAMGCLPRRRGAARRARDRRRPRDAIPVGSEFHPVPGRRSSALSPPCRRSLVRGRDLPQGGRGVALRVPGRGPVRPGGRCVAVAPERCPGRQVFLCHGDVPRPGWATKPSRCCPARPPRSPPPSVALPPTVVSTPSTANQPTPAPTYLLHKRGVPASRQDRPDRRPVGTRRRRECSQATRPALQRQLRAVLRVPPAARRRRVHHSRYANSALPTAA